MKTKQSRKWLNPVGFDDTGAISWQVALDGEFVDGSLSIRDCSRQISLSFSMYSKDKNKEAEERAKKLDILISELQAFRQALGEAYEESLKHEGEGYGGFE
jgi:hypothetical protein